MRTEAEVRAEIAKWRAIAEEHRKAHRQVDAAYCVLLIAGLAWVLKESDSPAHAKS